MRHFYARTRALALAAALAVGAVTLMLAVPSYAAAPEPSASAVPVVVASDAATEPTTGSDDVPATDVTDVPMVGTTVAAESSAEPGAAPSENVAGADESTEDVSVPAQSARSTHALAAALDVSALAADDTTSCVYANATSGEYKDTLCWIDFSYTNSAGQRAAITTQYLQSGTATVQCTSARNTWSCTATITYASVLGSDFGSVTRSGTGTGNARTAATTAATAAAQAAIDAALYVDGGVYYGDVKNYPVTVPLSDGAYTFTAKLSLSAPRGSGQEVRAYKFPTYSASYLGNSLYVVPANVRDSVRPAIYQGPSSANGNTTTVALTDIQVTRSGARFSGYSVVVADAESTDGGESITWSQAGGQGFRWLPNNPTAFASAGSDADRKIAAVGNACPNTNAAMWATLATPSAGMTCSADVSSAKSGTAMLQALPPADGSTFSVTQQMKGSGLQGVAFGVLTSRASVTVKVDSRITTGEGVSEAGSFSASIGGAGLTRSADTGGSDLTASRTLELPVPSTGAQLTFATSTDAPNGTSYTVAWTCTKTGAGATAPWQSNGSSTPPAANDPWFILQPSAFIDCVVTYTPPYLTLTKAVDNGNTGATNTPAQFTLSASGSGLSAFSVPGSPAAKIAVMPGTYSLSESGPTTPWQYGYDWTALSCTAPSGTPAVKVTTNPTTGAVTAATVAVVKGASVVCSYTNTALVPRLAIAKSADPASGTTVDAGQVITYTLTFDNSAGTAAAPVNHVDHLRDVLDDAVLNTSSIRYGIGATPPSATTPSGVTATPTGITTTSPTIALSGSVPRGQIRTVSFTVTVKQTTTDAAARRAEVAPLGGYVLRNYLTAAGVEPPSTCATPAGGSPATCTAHDVRVPSVVLPLSGGTGWVFPALAGGSLLLLAAAGAWWRRRRGEPELTTSNTSQSPRTLRKEPS